MELSKVLGGGTSAPRQKPVVMIVRVMEIKRHPKPTASGKYTRSNIGFALHCLPKNDLARLGYGTEVPVEPLYSQLEALLFETGCRVAAPMVVLAVVLTACAPDPSSDLKSCQESADRFFPAFQVANMDSPRSKFIIGCMATKKYDFDFLLAGCDSKLPLASQSNCYSARAR